MTSLPTGFMGERALLDPLATHSLGRRFPHLRVAMDGEAMTRKLQSVLLEGTGLTAEGCTRPRAHLLDTACRFQYPLKVRTPAGQILDVLVLGTMFPNPADCAKFERSCLAPLAQRWSRPETPHPKPTGVLESLAMAVSVFPVHEPLPTLVDVTDPRRMTEAFRSMGLSKVSVVTRVELARLGRTTGCVLRYHLGPDVVYGKVGSRAGADEVRTCLDSLARHSSRLGGSVLFPRVLGHSVPHDLLLLTPVPGSRPDLGTPADLKAAVDGAARAAAAIHASKVAAHAGRTFEDELARSRQAVGRLEHAPAVAAWLTDVIDTVAAFERKTPRAALALAHGDFTPSQMLLAGSRVGILDFDGLCQAEAAFDLGRFIAYLRVAMAKSGEADFDRFTGRFLAAYRAAEGLAVVDQRVELYATLSLALMAVHSWERLKPSRLQLIHPILHEQISRLS